MGHWCEFRFKLNEGGDGEGGYFLALYAHPIHLVDPFNFMFFNQKLYSIISSQYYENKIKIQTDTISDFRDRIFIQNGTVDCLPTLRQ